MRARVVGVRGHVEVAAFVVGVDFKAKGERVQLNDFLDAPVQNFFVEFSDDGGEGGGVKHRGRL